MKSKDLMAVAAFCGCALLVSSCGDDKKGETPEAPAAAPAQAPAAPAATPAEQAPAPAAPAGQEMSTVTPPAAVTPPAPEPAAKVELGSVKSYDDLLAIPKVAKDAKVKDALTALKEGKADINAEMPKQDKTPLAWFAQRGLADAVAFLISQGADVNLGCGRYKSTPFMHAAWSQSIPTMQLLLKAGADPKAVNTEGRNALFDALRRGPFSMGPSPDYNALADFFVDVCGLDLNAGDEKGMTPLMYNITFYSPEQIQHMISKGADPKAKTKEGVSLVYYVCGSSKPAEAVERLKALEQYDLDYKMEGYSGPSPLYRVLTSMHCKDSVPLLEYLLEKGVRTDYAWPQVKYTLMYAAAGNIIADSPALLQYLVDHKLGDVNDAPNHEAATPLMNVKKGFMVEVLIKAGADPKLVDKVGRTAYQRATRPEVKKALEACGVTE
ncbi:MAG: ankyrin repeat domain-containing protein [Akkermansia sp.]